MKAHQKNLQYALVKSGKIKFLLVLLRHLVVFYYSFTLAIILQYNVIIICVYFDRFYWYFFKGRVA